MIRKTLFLAAADRFDAMMKGEVEATTLPEPYVTLAEKNGWFLRATLEYHTSVLDHSTVNGLLREATRKYPDDADA